MNGEENIDIIIIKYLSGNASPEEAMQLEDWKLESEDNLNYFIKSEKTHNLIQKNNTHNEINQEVAWQKVKKSTQENTMPFIWYRPNVIKIAASILILCCVGLFAYFYFGPKQQIQYVYKAKTEVQRIKIEDQTEVKLQKGASLVLDKNFGKTNRTVFLKGSADFKITHQEDLPFIIDADNFFIKDIGTKFKVRNSLHSDSVFIYVTEGTVLLYDSMGAKLELTARGKAVYVRADKKLIDLTVVSTKDIYLAFEHTSLEKVVTVLNETYRTNITVENKAILDCKITSKFIHEELETVLFIISETLGLKIEKTPTGYLLKGDKCSS